MLKPAPAAFGGAKTFASGAGVRFGRFLALVGEAGRVLEKADERLLERLGVTGFDQLRRRARGQDLAGVHERDAVAAHRLVHEVRGEKDRHPVVAGESDQIFPELVAGDRIDARCRLVQDQHLGAMLDGHRQLQALTDAERQAFRLDVGHLPEPEPVEHLVDALAALGDREIEQLGVKLEVVSDRELAIEREGLRHVADAPAHLDVFFSADGLAEQLGRAFGRRQKAGQHLHRGGLAAAVRAEKAEDFALLDFEAHVIDRDELVEPLGEPDGFDRRRPALMLQRRNLDRLVALALFLGQERDERRLEVFGAGAALDLGRRAGRDHVAAVHGREPGVLLRFVHVGGRDHHAHLRPASADAVDQLPELPPRQRIDAGRRLVQDQEIGIVDQRAAERQLLLHAAG